MSHLESDADRAGSAASKALLTAASALLMVPIVALLWVDSYARVDPTFAGFPFFIWYQFLWVFLASGFTYAAFRVIESARGGDDR